MLFRSGVVLRSSMRISIFPFSVNLIALPNRLVRTCCIRIGRRAVGVPVKYAELKAFQIAFLMHYRQLGNSGINVSVLGLGTMTWGHQNTESDAHQQIELALAEGVNLIDTAGAARTVNAQFYLPFEAYITAGVFYLCLTFILVRLFKLAERRWLSYLAPRKH